MKSEATPSTSRWHIHVQPRTPQLDGHGRDVLADVRQAGLAHIEGIRSSKIYFLAGRLTKADVELIAEALLTDPVAETWACREGFSKRDDAGPTIEVHIQPGVMNPAANSAREAARRLLTANHRAGASLEPVHTARRYEILGARKETELERIARSVLANACIETWYIQGFDRTDTIPEALPTPPDCGFEIRRVPIRNLGDKELASLSRDGHLFLSVAEMCTIRDYYIRLDREPTDLELETLAQTWSEHCVHKTLKSAVDYTGDDFGKPGQVEVRFENLLKETVFAATEKLNRDWCLSVFADNAGIMALDGDFGIAFKVETHNHPSAIEPYGGAATGTGGCIRDILGCGLGAKPIASTDVFCVAPPDFDPAKLPKDVLHPRRILKGIVRGVRDYGNRMGIPTVNGAIFFDERYLANPLVFCGCVGLIPRNRIDKEPKCGNKIVVVGGRTGRDGIHGATFSSAELTDTHADEFSHAVQIGNAIEEKKVLDALLLARDHPGGCLYTAVTDCGAGGLSSAVGEMSERLGSVVDLETIPLKYTGLRYDEIWISEAQERMVFSVPPDRLETFLAIFRGEEVEATVIGTFTDDRVLHVRYEGQTVGKLDMTFLYDGLPRLTRTATWTAKAHGARRSTATALDDLDTNSERLLQALGELNTASKEWVIRQYDHEVQGRSVIKPLAGPGFGPSDAAVLRPLYESHRGIALACGLNPELGEVDPYWMAIEAVDEALRNVICVGANPDRIAILDNFCWPKVDSPESMGTLVRACRGAHDAAVAFGLPFISGKDSLNNEFSMSEEEAHRVGLPPRIAIPPTLLISALGIVNDVRRCLSMDLKTPGNVLAIASAPVERAGLETARALHRKVADLIAGGKVKAAHDVSDGGLAVAVAEMCIASNLGASVTVSEDAYAGSMYSNTATTYILEMAEADAAGANVPVIGRVEQEPHLRIHRDSSRLVDLPVTKLGEAWRAPLADGGGG